MTSAPVAADGSPVVIRIPANATREPVRGRVVDGRGDGVANARVSYRIPIHMRGGQGVSTGGGHVETGADGAFVDGHTEVLSVPSCAVAAVLSIGSREVARVPVALTAGRVTEVRF